MSDNMTTTPDEALGQQPELGPGRDLWAVTVAPGTTFGDTSQGFIFGNTSDHTVKITVTLMTPPPPPPKCGVDTYLGIEDEVYVSCQLAPFHDGLHSSQFGRAIVTWGPDDAELD